MLIKRLAWDVLKASKASLGRYDTFRLTGTRADHG